MNYYNDNDPNSAATLRELIRRGLISNGIVDDRSILDVEPSDLRGFTQCHFFAGAGVWSYALRLAGFRDDWEVWTGSPPCQPFSVAGAGLGVDDARHLSPKFASLVRACRPPLLFGEQVASAQVFGPSAKGNRPGFEGAPPWAWVDDLCDRLEAAHYAVGANDVPNAGVGAPHIRQRTYFGAIRLSDPVCEQCKKCLSGCAEGDCSEGCGQTEQSAGFRGLDGLADDAGSGSLSCAHSGVHRSQEGTGPRYAEPERSGATGWLAHSLGKGLERHFGNGDNRDQSGRLGTIEAGPASSCGESDALDDRSRPGPVNGFWRDADWLFCRDGKWRPTQPGLQPLADGTTARVGRLRLYGNAINPWPAKIYIEAFCEAAGIPLVPDYLDALGLMSLYK